LNPTLAKDKSDISKRFFEVFERDKKEFVRDWLVAWDYQISRKKKKVKYNNDLPQDFYEFNGKEDLISWMNWFQPHYPDYIANRDIKELIDLSLEVDKKLFQNIDLNFPFENYRDNIGLNNAHDFLYPNFYPVPERYKIKNIIDFGAGYGRQANLWTKKIKDSVYVGMDAIPKSYCLQNLYYSNLDVPFYEYIDDSKGFKIDKNKSGIYHIPTWRYDLLPDNSFDLVIAVQVFPELNSKLKRKMLNEFRRVLKPGGMIYIRDHAATWKPEGKLDVDSYLEEIGFVLEFKAHIINDKDIHGVPRIYRKADPEVLKSQTMTFSSKLNQFINDVDKVSGGFVKKLGKKLKK